MSNQVVIENPIINAPFDEPQRHFDFDDEGITNTIVEKRRQSCYFVPIAQPRKKASAKQLAFETEWTGDRIEPNKMVNDIRRKVRRWREARYADDVTPVTARLLQHWRGADRSPRLFFCQIEALETLIYITEVARKYGDNAIDNDIRAANSDANPGLFRVACKMAIVNADKMESGEKRLLPIPKPYDTVGSTQHVDFDTTRATYKTDPEKCHISHVVADTESWEQKMAQALEEMPEVVCYAKNHNLGFLIPYTMSGDQGNYIPDFLIRVDDGHGREDPLNLIVEVSGQRDADKAAKVATARNLWIPAVNNAATWGRWAFVEIDDPWDAKNALRGRIERRPGKEIE